MKDLCDALHKVLVLFILIFLAELVVVRRAAEMSNFE